MEYTVIRSARKHMAIQVDLEGKVLVRAPYFVPNGMIRAFVSEKEEWIRNAIRKIESRQTGEQLPKLSAEELKALMDRAKEYIPQRVQYFAPIVGVTYGRITIRSQHTRWGSCSAKGNLNFNCLLMLTPSEVIDSVVVHELCHRKEMNHSKRFYDEVLRVYPEYRKWNKWLKQNGTAIMRRNIG